MNKGGFSWKRAAGISGAKSKLSRRIGVPLTKGGRQRKLGRMVSGGGCALIIGVALILGLLAGCAGSAAGVPPTVISRETVIVRQTVPVAVTREIAITRQVVVTQLIEVTRIVERIITSTPAPATVTPKPAPPPVRSTNTPRPAAPAWTPEQVIAAFKSAGLEAENVRPLTKDDYGIAPMTAQTALRFFIPALGPDLGGRLFSFANQADLIQTKNLYDEFGRASGLLFSWTFARDNILVQINGDLPESQARKYEQALHDLR